jgi:sortase A
VAKIRAGRLEIASWVVGLALLAFVSAALIHRWTGHNDSIDAFREAQRQFQAQAPVTLAAGGTKSDGAAEAREALAVNAAAAHDTTPAIRLASLNDDGPAAAATAEAAASLGISRSLDVGTEVDTSLWSEARIKGYEESLTADLSAPSALLHIPSIDLTVPVLEGVDEVSLNRGVGRIPGTARVGGQGNLGIAGHRDGYFRRLKDIGPGSRLELETLSGRQTYTVSDIWIVKPSDVHVLKPTEENSITLVTCYPFYFVGHAPERYIVRATLD